MNTQNLVHVIESLVLPNKRQVCVARFATRWFLLLGAESERLAEYDVRGPYDTADDACKGARVVQGDAFKLYERRSAS